MNQTCSFQKQNCIAIIFYCNICFFKLSNEIVLFKNNVWMYCSDKNLKGELLN